MPFDYEEMNRHHGTVRQISFSADGQLVAFCLEDGHVQVWNIRVDSCDSS